MLVLAIVDAWSLRLGAGTFGKTGGSADGHRGPGRPVPGAQPADTTANPETKAINLLQRHFGPKNLELDTTWAGDMRYVRTWEGWAYLATVIDLASRRVVGWAIADHM